MHWLGLTGTLPAELAALLLVVLSGAFGSCLEALVSFADRTGNRTLEPGWLGHSLARVVVGAAVAALIYGVLRLLLLVGADVSDAAVAALAGLAGLGARKAVLRLLALVRFESRRRLAAWLQ